MRSGAALRKEGKSFAAPPYGADGRSGSAAAASLVATLDFSFLVSPVVSGLLLLSVLVGRG